MSTEILSLNEPKNLVDLDSALPRSRGPALDILGLFANNVVSFAYGQLLVVGSKRSILTRSLPSFLAIHCALSRKSANPRSLTFLPHN
jgi:hypothetical protein